jgi:hypothetical protein
LTNQIVFLNKLQQSFFHIAKIAFFFESQQKNWEFICLYKKIGSGQL